MLETTTSIPTFADYVQDRKYTRHVSPKTLAWYDNVWKVFGPRLRLESNEVLKQSVREAVKGTLERGIKPVSVNSWLTGVRAYVTWLWNEGYLKERPTIQLLKCEQKVIETFSPDAVHRLISYRPKHTNETRAWLMACTVLDCGLRLSEVLGVRAATGVEATGPGQPTSLRPVGKGRAITRTGAMMTAIAADIAARFGRFSRSPSIAWRCRASG